MAPSDPNPRGLRPDSSTALTVSFAGINSQKAPQLPPGFIGDRPCPYNASLSLQRAMTGVRIVNASHCRQALIRRRLWRAVFGNQNLTHFLRVSGLALVNGPFA